MATSEADTRTSVARQRLDAADSPYMRKPLFPAIRWGAVIAGVAVGISVQMLLTLLGIATGLSSMDIAEGEMMGAGPLLWAGFSMLVAAFVGGYVAARMSGLKRKADGVLHGAVSWAVTTILFAVLATSIGGTLLSGVFSNITQAAGHAASSGSPLNAMLNSQLGRSIDPSTVQRLQQYLQTGQRDQAVALVSSLGVDQGRASTIVDQALIVSGSPGQASPQGRQKAGSAVKAAGTGTWVVFGAVTLALALGIAGGALGAAGSRRVNWSGGASPVR
ncbi:hypothetical protein [Noviherbaspirillum massiliense]|uniref:hypothetical protein n=1 Tax=Noviherbaspirillum massiliense TaxID=1465823 RepID=UPI000946AF64|nr:hypothetical protein [Noviherbaspirillum massiliense]